MELAVAEAPPAVAAEQQPAEASPAASAPAQDAIAEGDWVVFDINGESMAIHCNNASG